MSEKKKDKNNKLQILAEYEGSWIQYHNYEDFEAYDLFLGENLTMVSMPPEAFENLRTLFKMLESRNNKTKYVS